MRKFELRPETLASLASRFLTSGFSRMLRVALRVFAMNTSYHTAPNVDSLRLLARLNQILQVNFRPPAATLARWIQRTNLSGFLIPVPLPTRGQWVRLHYRNLFDVPSGNRLRQHPT